MLKTWDYNLRKNWKPKNEFEWIWYLERKINYDDWKGLDEKIISRYLPKLKLDPGKRLLLELYFEKYGK